jgi:nickel transport protein
VSSRFDVKKAAAFHKERSVKTTSALVLIVVLAVTAINVDAHGIWFAQRSGELAMIYGEGAEDGDMVKRLAGVRGVAAYDASGDPVATRLIPTDHLLFVDTQQKPVVITGVFDNGIWTVTPDNREVNKPKSEVPGARGSGHYLKYAVHVRGDLKTSLGALPGQTLQITPVSAALPKHMGDPLTLRALYQGKPLAGAAVIADFVNDVGATPLRTDGDGRVTVKVRNQGLNVISVVHETPAGSAVDTDKVQHRATLSFVLAP